jgi:probable H4MPT-linked C1 transfer pathway protein
MTGELCDCYESRREGVSAIIKAVRFASGGRRIRVWSTNGEFLNDNDAKAQYLKVASANWHALATLAGRDVAGEALLLDIGSTTTDLVPLRDGRVAARGKTDCDRLRSRELVYMGVSRTPVSNLAPVPHMAEYFATMRDVYMIQGEFPDDPSDTDTPDGRPATRSHALARMARMMGGDRETIEVKEIARFAANVAESHMQLLWHGIRDLHDSLNDPSFPDVDAWRGDYPATVIVSGSGEFLARKLFTAPYPFGIPDPPPRLVSLAAELGPAVSACAPAYAVAVFATESQ